MRRLFSIVIVIATVVTATVTAAQPKAPAKDPAPPGSGSDVTTLPEDPPPKDMEGRDEDPGKPGGLTVDVQGPNNAVIVKAKKVRPPGPYPIEEMWRPINLPANMSEVALGPHAQLKPYMGTDALRARYGITNKVQIGLTYVLGSIYNDNFADPMLPSKQKFHTGKAIGLDVTVLLTDWIGVRVGVPVYIKPVAVSIALGAPMKFQLSDKVAVGGLDDLLNIALPVGAEFAPSFYQEAFNARAAALDSTGSAQSAGQLRISGFAVYQHKQKLAFIGRTGVTLENFTSNKADAGGLIYSIRAGFQYSPRKYLDLGLNIGFDDLAESGSFGPAGFAAFRI